MSATRLLTANALVQPDEDVLIREHEMQAVADIVCAEVFPDFTLADEFEIDPVSKISDHISTDFDL